MWLTTFATRQGNICLRFGSRAVNIQACAAAKGVADLVRKYPAISGTIGVALPVLIQIYLASKELKNENK